MSLFPELTAEMIEAARIRSMADIFWITVCDNCGDANYGCRPGCCQIGSVKWVLRTADGRNLIEGVDVCLLEQKQRIDHCTICGAENEPQIDDICPECGAENCLISTWGALQHERYRSGERYATEQIQPCDDGPQEQ